MTDKIDTSPEALRALADDARHWQSDNHHAHWIGQVRETLRAIAAEKAAWASREAELVRERDEARQQLSQATAALSPLDAVVHELGIEDTQDDPAEAIRDLKRERDEARLELDVWLGQATESESSLIQGLIGDAGTLTAARVAEIIRQRNSATERAEQAEAEAAAMRGANELLCDELAVTLPEEEYGYLNFRNIWRAEAKCRVAFSLTAGRDLLARMERMRVALKVADTALTHDYPRDCWATGPATGDPIADLIICPGCEARITINAAIADQPGEKQ